MLVSLVHVWCMEGGFELYFIRIAHFSDALILSALPLRGFNIWLCGCFWTLAFLSISRWGAMHYRAERTWGLFGSFLFWIRLYKNFHRRLPSPLQTKHTDWGVWVPNVLVSWDHYRNKGPWPMKQMFKMFFCFFPLKVHANQGVNINLGIVS